MILNNVKFEVTSSKHLKINNNTKRASRGINTTYHVGSYREGDAKNYILFFTKGGITPILYHVNANWSAVASNAFERLDEPWPDLVSMRIN